MRRLGGFRGAPEQDDGCREGSRGACWRRDTIHVLGARKATLMNAQETRSSDPALVHLPSLLPELEALYTDVHAHPELSMQETRTAGLAAERLRASGYEVTAGIGKACVVGLLRNGAGPTVMLRADMDAMPVQEATGPPSGLAEASCAICSSPRLLPS